jgi:polyhydroxybutyrate depolymerase
VTRRRVGVPLTILVLVSACSDTTGTTNATTGPGGAQGSSGSVGGHAGIGGSGGDGTADAGAAGTGGRGGAGVNGGSTAGTGGSAGRDAKPDGGGTGGATDAGTCSATNTLKVGDATMSITADGRSRPFIVHVPSAYTGKTPVPLLLDFHWLGGAAQSEAGSSGYRAATEKDGAIYVAPEGIDNAWNVGPCCTTSRTINDVAFAKAIVAKVEATGCIDPKRVYATGMSMGGGISQYLACHAADVFAAVAPNAFDLLEENVATCTPSAAITQIAFRGTADTTVPYAGGASRPPNGLDTTIHFLGAVPTFRKWADLDGCRGTPEKGKYHPYCDTYAQCTGGAEVTLCTIPNGGHTTSDGNIDIAGVGWAMLKRHARQ